jgi:hypothetical protein
MALFGAAIGGPQHPPEPSGLPDKLVGRKHSQHGVGVGGPNNLRGQPDAGRRVALGRLGQHLSSGHFRKLADDLPAKVLASQNPDALGRDHRAQAVHGFLNQGALAQQREQLLGAALSAAGPETRASAPSQDEAVLIVLRHSRSDVNRADSR